MRIVGYSPQNSIFHGIDRILERINCIGLCDDGKIRLSLRAPNAVACTTGFMSRIREAQDFARRVRKSIRAYSRSTTERKALTSRRPI